MRRQFVGRAVEMHIRGLKAAEKSEVPLEIQRAYAATSQSTLELAAQEENTDDAKEVYRAAMWYAWKSCEEALALEQEVAIERARKRMVVAARVNYARALSAWGGDHDMVKKLLEKARFMAKKIRDVEGQIRCVNNLYFEAEEVGDEDEMLKYLEAWHRLARSLTDGSLKSKEMTDVSRELGRFYLNRKDNPEEAQAWFRKARKHNENPDLEPDIAKDLEIVAEEQGSLEDAKRGFESRKGQLAAALRKGDKRVEARLRVQQGDACLKLKKYLEVTTHLSRYFDLVDNHDCSMEVTGVARLEHEMAICNMGVACWKLNRLHEAVAWAQRELAELGWCPEGRAQALCNLGNYYDDLQEFDKAKKCMRESMEIAKGCGQDGIRLVAEQNMSVIEDKEAELAKRNGGKDPEPAAFEIHEDGADDEEALVVSDEVSRDAFNHIPSSGRYHHSRSHSGTITAERSSKGSGQHVRLAKRYRIMMERSGRPVRHDIHLRLEEADNCIILAQNKIESDYYNILGEEDHGDQYATIDLSKLILRKHDIACILRILALASIEVDIRLSLTLNFLFTPQAYQQFRVGPLSKIGSLQCVKRLDLACAGVDYECLEELIPALTKSGSLSHLKELDISKNALGVSFQVDRNLKNFAALLTQGYSLEFLDLSLNHLSSTFLVKMLKEISYEIADGHTNSKIRHLDLKLNNRTNPTTLLGFENPGDSAQHFHELVELLPSLRTIDVRACGAEIEERAALYQLNKVFSSRPDPPHLQIVSSHVFDEANPFMMDEQMDID